MADKALPQAGLGTGSTATTGLIGALSHCVVLLPVEYQDTFKELIPYISPFISWGFIWIYNRFVEPEDMARIKGKLKRDARYLKKCVNDKTMSESARAEAQKEYDETRMKLARLGREFSSGAYSQST